MKDYIHDYYTRRNRQIKAGQTNPIAQPTASHPHFEY